MTKTKPRTFGLVELLRKEKEQATENISPGTDESPSNTASPSADASPSIDDSPSTNASPVKLRALGVSDESPSTNARAFIHDNPKQRKSQNEKEYRKGDSRVNHDFFDDRICGLDPLSQLLYFHLNRYREASSNLTVTISWNRLMERIPVSESTLRRAYARLSQAGLVSKEREVFGKGGAQGIIFRVVTGASPSTSASPSTDDTHKRKALKENTKKEDELSLNTKNCPDCQGSGFWYPEGVEKGVARCKHERLIG